VIADSKESGNSGRRNLLPKEGEGNHAWRLEEKGGNLNAQTEKHGWNDHKRESDRRDGNVNRNERKKRFKKRMGRQEDVAKIRRGGRGGDAVDPE